MRSWRAVAVIGVALLGSPMLAQAQSGDRLNPTIALLQQKKPVFGLYTPSAGGGGRGGQTAPAPAKSTMDLVMETLGYKQSDYMFTGAMEGGVDGGLPGFTEYVKMMADHGVTAKSYPMFLKTPKISEDPAKAAENISRQLNAGASGIVMVHVESAEEVRQGIAAMRFRSKGGTRPDDVGSAPAYWGVSEAQYRERADVWPLSPNGELAAWVIVETQEGLDHVREIAAVPGISALFPGAGTLRGLFSATGADGQRVVDQAAHEAAIQKVLAACKEFNVACGYPANENDVETRMQQGFSVFVIGWGDAGFRTVEKGRRVASR